MKILELTINDLKKIKVVEIHPESGKPIILTGDNGNGKSSVLDGIVLALANNGLEDPIRHGRPSANVKLTLGADKVEYLLERKVTKKGSYLTLTDAEGIPVQKAQTFLNGLLGNYGFDPLEFTRLKSKAQVEALKEAAGLDFTELDGERATAYASRTAIGRQGKEMKARFDGLEVPEEDVPTEEQSASALIDELRGLESKLQHLHGITQGAARSQSQVESQTALVAKLKDELDKAQTDLFEAENEMKSEDAALVAAEKDAPTENDLTTARDAVEGVDKVNAAIRAARIYRDTKQQLKDLRAKHGALEREIEVIDETKSEAVKNSSLPLDGLELTDDGVMFDGTFFSQLSTAEQIRVSTLVAMSQNPGLHIIIIREGALMNTANLKMISDLAVEQDYQLWIEKFQEEKSSIGLHIVEGEIVE
jgi:DNA repair exonuclease SbcCD ATPase subunit